MSETGNRTHYTYRSLFWPIILIGVGFVWLLEICTSSRRWAFTR